MEALETCPEKKKWCEIHEYWIYYPDGADVVCDDRLNKPDLHPLCQKCGLHQKSMEKVRKQLGMTQDHFAEVLGISKRQVIRLEKNKKPISKVFFNKVLDYLRPQEGNEGNLENDL